MLPESVTSEPRMRPRPTCRRRGGASPRTWLERVAWRSSYELWFRIFVIWFEASVAASLTLFLPVKIETSMFWSTFELSTLAQFGVAGTNQLNFAASAKGASCGFAWLMPTSVVVFGMLPFLASAVSDAVLVKALIQSRARSLFLLGAVTARSEPPRNDGM